MFRSVLLLALIGAAASHDDCCQCQLIVSFAYNAPQQLDGSALAQLISQYLVSSGIDGVLASPITSTPHGTGHTPPPTTHEVTVHAPSAHTGMGMNMDMGMAHASMGTVHAPPSPPTPHSDGHIVHDDTPHGMGFLKKNFEQLISVQYLIDCTSPPDMAVEPTTIEGILFTPTLVGEPECIPIDPDAACSDNATCRAGQCVARSCAGRCYLKEARELTKAAFPPPCFCDALCISYGDCCDDAPTECPIVFGSCANRCNRDEVFPGACECASDCENCCADQPLCPTPEPTPEVQCTDAECAPYTCCGSSCEDTSGADKYNCGACGALCTVLQCDPAGAGCSADPEDCFVIQGPFPANTVFSLTSGTGPHYVVIDACDSPNPVTLQLRDQFTNELQVEGVPCQSGNTASTTLVWDHPEAGKFSVVTASIPSGDSIHAVVCVTAPEQVDGKASSLTVLYPPARV